MPPSSSADGSAPAGPLASDQSRPTGWLAADGSLPAGWLLAQWPPQAAEPTDYSLADLPETTPLPELVRQRRVRALNAEVPAEAWARRSAGAGAHGLRLYDWARIELLAGFDPGWARWVLARRSIPTDGEQAELAFYVCAGPAETSLEHLVAVARGRWRIEECFQAAKNRAGWPPTRSVTTPPGTGTSPWPCSPTPTCSPPAPPRKKGIRSRNRPAQRADRARAAAPAQHPHPRAPTRPGPRRGLVVVARTAPGAGPCRPLPEPRTGN